MLMLCASAIAWRTDRAALASSDIDTGSFWASGEARRQGLDPYSLYSLLPPDGPGQAWGIAPGGEHPMWRNLNPPALLPLFELLPLVDPVTAARAGILLSAALYAGALAWLAGRPGADLPRLAWAAFFAGFWGTIVLGQIYVLVFFPLALGAFNWGRKRGGGLPPVAAGICMGILAALRPPLMAWPALMLLSAPGERRSWLMALGALLGAGAAMILPLAIYGPGIYAQYIAGVAEASLLAHTIHPGSISLSSMAAYLGGKWMGLGAGAALMGIVALWAWRCRPGFEAASRVAIVAALMAAPVAWMNYLLVWLPFGLARGAPWGRAGWAGALLLALPVILPMQALGGPLWLLASLGPLYLWGTALMLSEELSPDIRLVEHIQHFLDHGEAAGNRADGK